MSEDQTLEPGKIGTGAGSGEITFARDVAVEQQAAGTNTEIGELGQEGLDYMNTRITYIKVDAENTTADPAVSTMSSLVIGMSNGRGIEVTPNDAGSISVKRT